MTYLKHFAIPTALGAGMLIAMAIDASAIEISDISVRSESAIVADNAATDFWPNLEDDLKQALVAELADVSNTSGAAMQVTVRELSVSDVSSKEADDAVLKTSVMFIAGGAPVEAIVHGVSVNQEREGGIHDDRILIPRTSEEFYDNLVQYYAKTVAEKVKALN